MMAGRLASLFRGRSASTEDGGGFAANAEKARRQGQLERAVQLCREGLTRAPEQLSARVTLGRALMDLGQYEDAKAELEYVIRRAPDNLAAIRGMAELHDRAENAALLQVEQLGDWPPRDSDIALTVELTEDRSEEPGTEAEPAQPADSLPPAAVELLEESEALEAIADETTWVEPSAPEIALDSESEISLEAIASELAEPDARATPDPAAAASPAISLEADLASASLDGHAETDAAVMALERLLEKARARRDHVTAGSAA